MIKFQTLPEAQEYLFSFRKSNSEQGVKDFRFQRVLHLAALLGDPQNKIKVIHVAGTSGKGSTCSIISHVLSDLGLKVGISISPHLYDIRERAQINNENLSRQQFLRYINDMLPMIEKMKDTEYGSASFFEIMIVLAYYIFWKEEVDYAVMETGAGGRVDATNVATAKNKIAVVTKIGLDHIDILGKTIKEIAGQKADIIHKGNISITIQQRPIAQKVVSERANNVHAQLNTIIPSENFKNFQTIENKLRFDFEYKEIQLKKLYLSLNGLFQVENASLALATVYEASIRDGFEFNEKSIRETLGSITSPGRFDETVIDGKRIIIDGAHNPQKMSAFIRSLKKKYPDTKFDFLVAFKHGKDYRAMLKYIVPLAGKIYTTQFAFSEQVLVIEGEHPENIKLVLQEKYSFSNTVVIESAAEAFYTAKGAGKRILVITGSLYLIAELYRQIHRIIDINKEVLHENRSS